MKYVVLMLLIGCCCSLQAQQGANTAQAGPAADAGVRQVVELYFDGWGTGDSVKVGRAMHATCHLKFFRDGKFTDMNRQQYLSGFKLRERDPALVTRIVYTDVTGNIAGVKAEIITKTQIFTDYFNMIQTDEGWMITDKVSVRTPKPETAAKQ